MKSWRIVVHLDYNLLERCDGCGACSDICPSCLNLPGYDPRKVIKDILADNYEHWLTSKSIWQCLECHNCLELCYQRYGFENAMTAMRTLAAKRGITPPQVKRGWDIFLKTGRLGDPQLPARKRLGLPPAAKGGTEDLKRLFKVYKHSKGTK
jgi:heterodisulfide reductase subunit C